MHYGAAHSVGSPPLVGRGWGWGSWEMTILCLNRRAPHPTPCMGLSVSSSNFDTRFSPLAWSFDWGVAVDGPAPLDHHESGGAGPSTAPARSRQSEASLPSGGDDRATTLYSVWDGSWRASARHPNHDAAMRIGGEAPRRRAHSLPRQQAMGWGGSPPPRIVLALHRAGGG